MGMVVVTPDGSIVDAEIQGQDRYAGGLIGTPERGLAARRRRTVPTLVLPTTPTTPSVYSLGGESDSARPGSIEADRESGMSVFTMDSISTTGNDDGAALDRDSTVRAKKKESSTTGLNAGGKGPGGLVGHPSQPTFDSSGISLQEQALMLPPPPRISISASSTPTVSNTSTPAVSPPSTPFTPINTGKSPLRRPHPSRPKLSLQIAGRSSNANSLAVLDSPSAEQSGNSFYSALTPTPVGHTTVPGIEAADGTLKLPNKLGIKSEELEKISWLGDGASAFVEKVIWRHIVDHVNEDGTVTKVKEEMVMAKKVISIDTRRTLRRLDRAIRIMAAGADLIVGFYGALHMGNDVWVLMEHMNLGSLDRLLRRASPHGFPEHVLAHIAYVVTSAMNQLYKQFRMIHRDIKPANLLINSDGKVKVADFGETGELSAESRVASFVGTSYYMGPERINPSKDSKGYQIQADVWSLGITLIELADGHHPYASGDSWDIPMPPQLQGPSSNATLAPPAVAIPLRTPIELLQAIVHEPAPRLSAKGKWSEDFTQFISVCLIKDPDRRPKPSKLLQEPWLLKAAQTFRESGGKIDMAGWLGQEVVDGLKF
ncbi:MAP kinase kinase (MEK) [Gonapodya sp. JEL0774]|nr:MAP kinase kinase (MEK) [Gonapodya sp. JEL0774]